MQLKIYEFDMKLKYPFSISRHTYNSQPNIVLEMQYDGLAGYGEATINPYYHITIDNLKESFDAMNKKLKDYNFKSPDQLFDDFSDYLEVNSFALGALNNASWDLYGKLNNCPVSKLIDLPKFASPLTSYTLGIDKKEALLKKLEDLPWPVYKIKLGTPDDLDIIKFIRKHTNSIIRVDANCAWDFEQTVNISRKLKALNVEFIEQPLTANSTDQKLCYTNTALPLIADESCCTESDVEPCKKRFHGINIKLLKCGGLSPALRMIKKARDLGLKIMVGCMTESSIGISAAAQLLPFVDYADLDGPLILAEDLASGLTFEYGNLLLSGKNGFGILFKGKE
ncbi:MAG: dipeptide epimerase [Cyclobacteriaceae bacterium]|nr:dipeptide epimerase [Cyclobacteriaceae bacterium]